MTVTMLKVIDQETTTKKRQIDGTEMKCKMIQSFILDDLHPNQNEPRVLIQKVNKQM